jgi:hypothetical protein
MPTLLEKYEGEKTALGVDKIGKGASFKGNEGGFYSGDTTPYTLGNGYAGKMDIDEESLTRIEQANASGNRYQVGSFGGGSQYLKNGYTDKKKYGKTDRTK